MKQFQIPRKRKEIWQIVRLRPGDQGNMIEKLHKVPPTGDFRFTGRKIAVLFVNNGNETETKIPP